MKLINKINTLVVLLFVIFSLLACEQCNHEYEITSTFAATCEQSGYTLKVCTLCHKQVKTDIVPKTDHHFCEWQLIEAATMEKDGIEKRICEVCFIIEERYVSSINYIDLSVLMEDIDITKTVSCNSQERLQLAFDTAVLHNAVSLEVEPHFVFEYDGLLQRLVDGCTIESNYKVNMQYGSTLKFSFAYNETATTSTDQGALYVQYNSANNNGFISTRSETFDNFKINKSKKSYKVSTSSQLHYVLERGVLPIPEKNSKAEVVYNLAKDVLRNICDDSMSDYDKIKAIHDYLILNVTYDAALYDLFFVNPQEISKYNGFYLEGVFMDKLAVCEGISKAFSVLCNIEGIRCVSVSGYQTANPNGVGHEWNKVYLDGKWYIVDVTSDGTIINGKFEILSYQYFLIDENTMKQTYIGTKFTNLICDSNYQVYQNMTFIQDEVVNDFYIDSFNELIVIIKYYETLNVSNKTIQFYVGYDFGSSFLDDLQNAYLSLRLPASFSHIIHENIITLVKE